MPRQHIYFYEQAEDISDAITYVADRPEIDGHGVAIWGVGHGAGVVI